MFIVAGNDPYRVESLRSVLEEWNAQSGRNRCRDFLRTADRGVDLEIVVDALVDTSKLPARQADKSIASITLSLL